LYLPYRESRKKLKIKILYIWISYNIIMKSVASISKTAILFTVCSLFIASCLPSKYGSAKKHENQTMTINETPEPINYASLKAQSIPTMASRGAMASKGDNQRGMVEGLVGTAISLATQGVKLMIAKDQKKYVADYSYALTDLYFYDQLSSNSAFDPVGMQFNGFTLVRTFMHDGVMDTALTARFVLDTDHPYEIVNNSIFRLKLAELKLNYAKAKIAVGNKNMLNMDFEIIFNSSYVNSSGNLFTNAELGKFYFFLRNAPLDKKDPNRDKFYENLKGSRLDGQSFIVPRSFSYYINGTNQVKPCWSQGRYNITVNVRESSKNSFVNKIIMDNSNKIVESVSSEIKKKID
jgi:hypothetical protein